MANTQTLHAGKIKEYILDKCEPLTREEEKVASDHMLVKHNLRFMVKSFRKYLKFMSFSEYVSEIVNAMYVAASKYDRNSGNRFNTYARPWVSALLSKFWCQYRNGNYYTAVSINESAWKKYVKLNKFKEQFIEENGREPEYEDYKKEFNVKNKKTLASNIAMAEGGFSKSTDETVATDATGSSSVVKTFGDTLSEDSVFGETSTVYDDLEKGDMLNIIHEKLKTFDKMHQNVANCIYNENMSIRETAQFLKIPTNKVTKISNTIIESLREELCGEA